MSLPEALLTFLAAQLGSSLHFIEYISGGSINQAAHLRTASDDFFVKWNPHAPVGMFAAEAAGLARLAATHALRVPQVIWLGEMQPDLPDFLVLEWLPSAHPQNPNRFAEKLGEGLAALHLQAADQYGLDQDNFIGSLPQKNTQTNSWARFYGESRIGFQMEIARQMGRLTPERERLLNKLCEKMLHLVPDSPAPSLLHGDLWGGNYFGTVNDVPVIYDPAVYYGHREVELAFTELFGGFPQRFYQAYHAAHPLDSGYTDRKALYQLYPLMVHMNLFGGGYTTQVDNLIRRYLG